MSDALWDKVIENADAARLLTLNGLYSVACTRAYYAMFTAARVLLAEQRGIRLDAIKRHATLLQIFLLEFVQSGMVDKGLGQALSLGSRLRGLADYAEMTISAQENAEVLASMEKFLDRIEELRQSGKP